MDKLRLELESLEKERLKLRNVYDIIDAILLELKSEHRTKTDALIYKYFFGDIKELAEAVIRNMKEPLDNIRYYQGVLATLKKLELLPQRVEADKKRIFSRMTTIEGRLDGLRARIDGARS